MATAGPNIIIGVIVILLVVIAGILVWQGTNMVSVCGRKMFDSWQTPSEEDEDSTEQQQQQQRRRGAAESDSSV